MLPLNFPRLSSRPLHVLCIGAHSDDIEIGCGATVLHLLDTYPKTEVTWVVLSGNEERHIEARTSAKRFLEQAGEAVIELKSFRDGFFPHEGALIKDYFETLKSLPKPDVIFTHHRDDLHQDHRVVSELTRNTWRSDLILEYEIPKYDGDLGRPNLFVPVSQAHAKRKAEILMTCFGTQASKHWFDEELFLGLMRLRAVECASATRYAEGFFGYKLLLG